MIKELITKLMNWDQRPKESNWTKANRDLNIIERNIIMNKAEQDLKEEQTRIAEQQKKKALEKEEDADGEMRPAA